MATFKVGEKVTVQVYSREMDALAGTYEGTVVKVDSESTASYLVQYDGYYPGLWFYENLECNIGGARIVTTKRQPGQRLNSAAEVMQALLDGEKLQHLEWAKGEYVHLCGDMFCNQTGNQFWPYIYDTDWLIYTPPKRKVKSERWFAVVKDEMSLHCEDGLRWPVANSEAEARREYPNALTYVQATCEVEVD